MKRKHMFRNATLQSQRKERQIDNRRGKKVLGKKFKPLTSYLHTENERATNTIVFSPAACLLNVYFTSPLDATSKFSTNSGIETKTFSTAVVLLNRNTKFLTTVLSNRKQASSSLERFVWVVGIGTWYIIVVVLALRCACFLFSRSTERRRHALKTGYTLTAQLRKNSGKHFGNC